MSEDNPRMMWYDNIQRTTDIILNSDLNKMIQKEKLGVLSFEYLENDLKIVVSYCKKIKGNKKLLDLSEEQIKYLQSPCLNQMAGIFKKISEFDWAKHNNPKAVIDEYKGEFKSYFNVFMEGIARILPLINDVEDDDYYIKKISNLEKMEREMQLKQADMDMLLLDAKTAAGKLGVSEHAKVFTEQAEEHLKASKWWLGATVAIGVLTLIVAAFSLDWFMKDFEQLKVPGYAVQFAITKLVIFSILYFALVWASRNYRSNRHNYVVNKHRQNALSTFKTFVDAVKDDPKTENAILNKTTECIFSHEITGYLPKEPDNGPGMQQIFEILPKLNGKE